MQVIYFKEDRFRYYLKQILIWLGIFLLTLGVRLIFIKSRNFDEGLYALISKLLNQGFKPYNDFWVDKPPGMMIVNYLPIKIFGASFWTINLWYIFLASLCAFLSYRIFDLILKNSPVYGFLSAILFIVFSALPAGELNWIMTELYVILFAFLGIYCYILSVQAKENDFSFKSLSFLTGLFLAVTPFFRPTAAVFVLAFLLFYIATKQWKGFFYSLSGGVATIGLMALFILHFTTLNNFIFQVFSDRISHLSNTSSERLSSKLSWISVSVASSCPLWLLAFFSINKKFLKENLFLVLLWLWIGLTVIFYFFFAFAPGFPHEYSEAVGPLSILASAGLYRIMYLNKKEHLKELAVFACVIGLLFSIGSNVSNAKVWNTNELKVFDELKSYFDSNVKKNSKLLVLEYSQHKIGPWLYLVLNSPDFFHERLSMTVPVRGLLSEEADTLISKIKENRTEYVLLVGEKPPIYREFQPINRLHQYVMSNYALQKSFQKYNPFPGRTKEQDIKLYHRINPDLYTVAEDFNLSKIMGADKSFKNGKTFVRYTSSKEFVVYYPFHANTDLSDCFLDLGINGTDDAQEFSIDLVDTEGVWARNTFTVEKGMQKIRIYVSDNSFIVNANKNLNLNKIKQINIVFPNKAKNENVEISNLTIYRQPN